MAEVVEGMVSGWKNNFGVDRIDLNDCLTPAEKSWIPVAVGVPLVIIN